jgi:hypothetical protein
MAALLTPAERLSKLQATLPDVTLLAQALALSVRAEPELVRQIRLTLFPRSSAALEADLYFSPLVAQRTPDWILLDPHLALELQEEVVRLIRERADERARFARIRQIIQQAHSAAPFEIACEEEVIWLAVQRRRGGVKDARAAIDNILRGLLMRMLQGSAESLAIARWFASACRRMPMLARETQAFALLAFAASSTLGGRKIETSAHASLSTFEELARYLPESAPRIPLWMAPTSRGLHVTFVPMPGYERVEVPHTDPVLLELRPEDAPQSSKMQPAGLLMQLTPPQPGFVPLPAGPVAVRTLSRDLLLFRPRSASVQDETEDTPPEAYEIETPHPAFKNDVYISYSHLDSEWINQFQKVLDTRLGMLSARHVRIWRDQKLSGADQFDQSITDNIVTSNVLVAVITPAYLSSDWCRRELDTFLKGVEQTGGLTFGAQSRAFVVFRMPVPRDQIPNELSQVAGYRFYRPEESESSRFVEFEPSSKEFYDGIDRLAQDIQRLLNDEDGPGPYKPVYA